MLSMLLPLVLACDFSALPFADMRIHCTPSPLQKEYWTCLCTKVPGTGSGSRRWLLWQSCVWVCGCVWVCVGVCGCAWMGVCVGVWTVPGISRGTCPAAHLRWRGRHASREWDCADLSGVELFPLDAGPLPTQDLNLRPAEDVVLLEPAL